MQKTNNYNLNKPENDDLYDVNDMNDNMDVIDAELKEINTKVADAVTASNEHTENKNNPHEVTKEQLGLGSVENKSSATIRGELTSGNVTSALGYTPIDSSTRGSANGIAELDENGKVLASQLPSYVDDVIEGYLNNGKFYKESSYTTVINGESGKIYVDLSNNKTYRWSGSSFAIVSDTLALGETSSTAYRGDRGKVAYEHSQSAHAPSTAEKNQNAFSYIKVGDTTVSADTATDTLTLVAGDNITITPDATNDKITIKATDTVYTHPDSGATAGTYRSVTVNAKGHVTAGSNPTVTVAQGGTGATTAKGAEYNIIGGIEEVTSAVSDSTKIVNIYQNPSATQGTLYWRKVTDLWDYIKSKADSVYAKASHGTHVSYGTSAKALGTSSAGSATTVSRSDHVHALPALTSCTGTLSVAKGGTGATTASGALTNLGVNIHTIYDGILRASSSTSDYGKYIDANLSDYQFLIVTCHVANIVQNLVFINGDYTEQALHDVHETSHLILAGFSCDWANFTFKVRCSYAVGWTYENAYITKIVGFLKV